MDMQWGADGDFYLLTYGDGFFNINPDAGMYKWEYVKGQRAPVAVLTTDRTDGPLPLTVNFSSAGSSDARSGRLDHASTGTSATAAAHSIDPNPTPHLHGARPLHGGPDGHRLVRARSQRAEHDDHGRQHERRRWS